MNVIQRPDVQNFCASMKDYIIDTDSTIAFAIEYKGRRILEEEYSPDAEFKVRIRNLGKFCRLALWGTWYSEGDQVQSNAAGTFTYYLNNTVDLSCFVIYSRMFTKMNAYSPACLSDVNKKVTRMGAREYISILMNTGEKINLLGINLLNVSNTKIIYTHTGEKAIVTLDVSPDKIKEQFPGIGSLRNYFVLTETHNFEFLLDQTQYLETRCFRFKNIYDMPETLTTVGQLILKPNSEHEIASMYDVDRKFDVKVTDEYTANSGVIFLQSDYKLWHNLINAQEVDILIGNEWYPIIITKSNYERSFRKSVLKAVEFTFKMANPEHNNLIE